MNDYERWATPVVKNKDIGEYDVIVVGGGVAGCAAALAAARKNQKILLIEKMIMLGGLGTAGHVVIYLPLDDGYGRQVIGGISEELLKLSIKYASDREVPQWQEEGGRYEVMYNGPAFALALEELLVNEGVEILYDTLCVGLEANENTVQTLILENKSGQSRVKCKAVVDSTGDAEIFARAGLPCVAHKNSLAIWNYCISGGEGHLQHRVGTYTKPLRVFGYGAIDVTAKRHVVVEPYYGDSGDEVNRFVVDSHKMLLDYMKKHPDYYPVSLPSQADIRMARRIEGVYVIDDNDASRHFEDNVGGTGDWRRPGPTYEIPYRALYTETLKNVFAAGRCISASGEAWELLRCIPQAALTGQIAGTAASLVAERNQACGEVNVRELRQILSKDGVILDINQ